MFHEIMVPLDGSTLAERALPAAERLAGVGRGTLHLVWVRELLAYPGGPPLLVTIPAQLHAVDERVARTYLERQRRRLVAAGLSVRIATPLALADVGATLLDYEREAGIDLVVLCSHGRGGLARFALGSVAERLLRYGTVPLLLVRAVGLPLGLGRAVVPLDGTAAAEQALELVEHLAGVVVREVTLLRVVAAPEEGPRAERYLAEVAGRLTQANLRAQCRVAQGDPAACIAAVAGTDGFVVMATHGRSGVMRWALGSVADRVAHSGVAGVLLLRARAADAALVNGLRVGGVGG